KGRVAQKEKKITLLIKLACYFWSNWWVVFCFPLHHSKERIFVSGPFRKFLLILPFGQFKLHVVIKCSTQIYTARSEVYISHLFQKGHLVWETVQLIKRKAIE